MAKGTEKGKQRGAEEPKGAMKSRKLPPTHLKIKDLLLLHKVLWPSGVALIWEGQGCRNVHHLQKLRGDLLGKAHAPVLQNAGVTVHRVS